MARTERSYGGKTASQRAEERRARLIAGTIQVLADAGEAGATMTAICAAAGLTERYFYESFTSPDDAKVAALDSVSDEIMTLAAEVIATTPGSAEERIHAVMTAFVDFVGAAPEKVRMAVIHSSATPRLRARRSELLVAFGDFVAAEAASLYGADAWPVERGGIQGLVYAAGLSELVAAWLDGRVDLDAAGLVEAAEDLFAALGRRP